MLVSLLGVVGKRGRHCWEVSRIQHGPEPNNAIEMIVEVKEDDRAFSKAIYAAQKLGVVYSLHSKFSISHLTRGIDCS